MKDVYSVMFPPSRLLSFAALLFAVTASAVEPLPRIISPPVFATVPGTYQGVITVTESMPKPPATAILPVPTQNSVVQNRATGRLRASVSGGRMRLMGAPGSSLLGYLDEAAFASLSLQSVIGSPTSQRLGVVVKARKGTGEVRLEGERIRLRFEIPVEHTEFAAADQTLHGAAKVVIVLTRVGD